MLVIACRYVVQKIQAAVRGEPQPRKASTTACRQAEGGFVQIIQESKSMNPARLLLDNLTALILRADSHTHEPLTDNR